MAETKIEWTATHRPDGTVAPGYTFNPWRGCQKVSPACAHCYAEKMSLRNPAVLGEWGPGSARVLAAESYWRQPVRWDRAAEAAGERRRVFCLSLGDVFEDRPDLVAPRERLWALIHATPHLDWLLLTKRPAVMVAWSKSHGWPDNAWAGVTVEEQGCADRRIPLLLQVPARVRFLSMEPLLEAVTLSPHALGGYPSSDYWAMHGPSGPRVDWVIVGGESGPRARPMSPEWARSLRDECVSAGVPFFFKQWGRWAPWDDDNWSLPDGHDDVEARDHARRIGDDLFLAVGKKAAGRLLDGRTWDEAPVPAEPAPPLLTLMVGGG